MKLPAPLAIALQTAFNRYAELDPDSKHRLQKLQGKVVCFQIEGLEIPVWFIFNEQSVEVVEDFGDTADAVIAGGPFSLLALASGKRSIFDGGVTITGDTETAQKFSRCLNEIDIDWEEHLSRVTGDAAAHQLGRQTLQAPAVRHMVTFITQVICCVGLQRVCTFSKPLCKTPRQSNKLMSCVTG